MSYKGIEMTSQKDYIFENTYVYNPEFDIEELKVIQKKLEDYISGKSITGITPREAEVFLDWVTFNARCFATRGIPESALTASMVGQCAPTQGLNYKLLHEKMGLDVRTFNTADCIGEFQMTAEDIQRVQNGLYSTAVRHSAALAKIPIVDKNCYTKLSNILLDPTFRQFCLKENCDNNKFFDEDRIKKGYVAPHPGYFMQADNLVKFGVSKEASQKTEMLGRYLITKGYIYLNEENAKLYGDTFVRASERIEFQNMPIRTTGAEYIRNFENIQMKILNSGIEKSKFFKLPSEMKIKRPSVFSRVAKFFKAKYRVDKPLVLGPGRNFT